jgi:endonuclease/exonuclease/phosphatase family metal-dependent hydrolase
MAHNMALLPALYKGTDRSGVIGQIVAQILAARPTIVGLSEVWVGDERDEIREALGPWYPHALEGPSPHLPKVNNGGLLLLSSEPATATNSMIYSHCDMQDCIAAKGILHMRLASVDVFLSHTQDIMTANGASALYAQLNEMNRFVESHRDPSLTTLIMGDLNIPGENAAHYAQLLQRLGEPIDCWTAMGNAPDSGYTEIIDSNFYDDPDDRPKENQRLDYVLLKAGSARVAMLGAVDVLTFTHNGRYISDHFGISARFPSFGEIT